LTLILDPITPTPATPAAYLTPEEAAAFALRVADTAAWEAAEGALRQAALVQASDEIDTCTFLGMRYDTAQDREFPRVYAEDLGASPPGPYIYPPGYRPDLIAGEIWDLADDGTAVVPERVKFAAFLQAISILRDPARAERLRAQRDGVTAQSAGQLSETYSGALVRIICMEAEAQLRPYMARSGRIV